MGLSVSYAYTCILRCVFGVTCDSCSLQWGWSFRRSDGSLYQIFLYQYQCAEDADPEEFRFMMGLRESASIKPHLRRFAVLSAPVLGPRKPDGSPGDRVNDVLNESIISALAWTKENMSKKGFQPEDAMIAARAETTDKNRRAYGAYFDVVFDEDGYLIGI